MVFFVYLYICFVLTHQFDDFAMANEDIQVAIRKQRKPADQRTPNIQPKFWRHLYDTIARCRLLTAGVGKRCGFEIRTSSQLN